MEQIAITLGSETDHFFEAFEEVYPTLSPKDLECQVVALQWLAIQYDPDDYYIDLESNRSFIKHFNEICVLEIGTRMGKTFPIMADLNVKINALYDTGAARSCMNYNTFLSLGLDLDDRAVPHVWTDMGAVGFTTLAFSINKHPFVQQFIVYWQQRRPFILGQDFSIHNCVGCQWTNWAQSN